MVTQKLQREVGAVGDAVDIPLLDAERHAKVGDVRGVLARVVGSEVHSSRRQALTAGGDGGGVERRG